MEFFCSIYFLASGSLHYAIQNFKQFYVLFVTLLFLVLPCRMKKQPIMKLVSVKKRN